MRTPNSSVTSHAYREISLQEIQSPKAQKWSSFYKILTSDSIFYRPKLLTAFESLGSELRIHLVSLGIQTAKEC